MTEQLSQRAALSSISELFFLVDRSLLARCNGQPALSRELARAAEAVLRADLPNVAADIAKVASRKGESQQLALRMIPSLTPTTASMLCLVLLLRGARMPAIYALREAYGGDPEFNATMRRFCARVFEPASATTIPKADQPVIRFPSVETSAPYRC